MPLAVINMIPNGLSGEQNQDSEPNLTINPANPLELAGSAFTPDPLGGTSAPIFVSTNGGNTWVLNLIVPSSPGTGDITLRFGASGILYAGILRFPGSLRLSILRTANFAGGALMTVLVDRNNVDQPYVQVATGMGGAGAGRDRVYVGNNDFGAGTATATIDLSLDGAGATPPPPSGFSSARLESRATAGQDLPAIRPAFHLDGTVYAVFYGWRSGGLPNLVSDVVVVRDDSWASGATPFTVLTDPGDNLSGRRVVIGVTVPFNGGSGAFGQDRLVCSNLSIAVDPRNSSTVYVAWADLQGTAYTLHVRRSIDRGATWSANDLRTVANATNPALAINSRGVVGFMYQQLTGTAPNQRYDTHLETTTNDWVGVTDRTLATVPSNTPAFTFLPYLGDYIHLLALGKDFHGIFSANNTPDNANFPSGVSYQRNANFNTQTLLANDGVTAVPVSIDPFYARLTELTADQDFYVRDWTDSPTSGDSGVEPSLHPIFYTTSDVWNRRTDAPGTFNANDQAQNQPPGHGLGTGGDNFLFARVRRNGSGSAATVNAHFLVSPLGTGSNFQDAGTAPDVSVPFAAGDLVQTMSVGYPWHLNPTTTTHLCLAVEISTPTDPLVQPGLLGRAPGWPTTDLVVISDNNKAQRNTEPGPAGGVGGTIDYFGLVHNAARERRDFVLRYEVLGDPRRLSNFGIRVLGSRARPLTKPAGELTVEGMEPGENRWVSLSVDGELEGEEPLPVAFFEVVDTTVVNGYALELQPLPLPRFGHANLESHAFVFGRLAAAFEIKSGEEESELAQELLGSDEVPARTYQRFLRERIGSIDQALTEFRARSEQRDSFGLGLALKGLWEAIEAGEIKRAAPLHATLLNRLDSFQTMVQKAGGDIADILQSVEWQRSLYASVPRLRKIDGADELLKYSDRFIRAYEARKLGSDEFPEFIRELFDVFERTAERLKLQEELIQLRESLGSPPALQKAHRALLLRLAELAG